MTQKRLVKKRATKKRSIKKVTRRKNPAPPDLYLAYVVDQDGKKFYYGGVSTRAGKVLLDDDMDKAVLFRSAGSARAMAYYNIGTTYGKSGLKSLLPIKSARYTPKR